MPPTLSFGSGRVRKGEAMKKIVLLLFASLVLSAPAAATADPRSGEARLERALRGRVPGQPVRCIPLRRAGSTEVIGGTAILYRVGSVLYVNRPRGGAESLRDNDVLVLRSPDGRLCSPEVVNLVDPTARGLRGFVSLGDFVPYKPARD